jgi:hypothetical protein
LAIVAHPLTAVDGAPVYTAQDYRFAVNPFIAPAPAASKPFACYQGVRGGAVSPLVKIDGITVLVKSHAGILCPWQSHGAYSYAFTTDMSVKVPDTTGSYKVAVILTDPSLGHGDTPKAALNVYPSATPDESIPGLVLAVVDAGVASDVALRLNGDGSITVPSVDALGSFSGCDGQRAHADGRDYVRTSGKWVFDGAFTEADFTNPNHVGWNIIQIRGSVHAGIASGMFWANRKTEWNAKAWDNSPIVSIPDYLKAVNIDTHFTTSSSNVLLQVISSIIAIRPAVDKVFHTGEWYSASFTYQLLP